MTRIGWQTAGIVASAAAVLVVALALLDYLGRDFVAQALGPIASLSETHPDTSAPDSRVSADNGERFLPVPELLEDDRVVDAIGPLVRLSCRRDDPVEAPAADMPADCPPLLRHSFNRLQTGQPQSLCQFHGKVLLIVNTASYCGYTGQYEGLEALYRKYKGRGLVVVGFPSNDFGGQEPGTNQEIAQFCRLTYGVQFPMFEKSSVTKVSANPLFATLSASTGVAPQWNFYKYVVDRDAQPIAGFGSRTTPDDRALVQVIERAIAQKPHG